MVTTGVFVGVGGSLGPRQLGCFGGFGGFGGSYRTLRGSGGTAGVSGVLSPHIRG